MEKFIYDFKKHSDLFNKYFCLVENTSEIELYYTGVSDFLKYKFRKILIEKSIGSAYNSLNENDINFIHIMSKI